MRNEKGNESVSHNQSGRDCQDCIATCVTCQECTHPLVINTGYKLAV
jgi:hypothetical protein